MRKLLSDRHAGRLRDAAERLGAGRRQRGWTVHRARHQELLHLLALPEDIQTKQGFTDSHGDRPLPGAAELRRQMHDLPQILPEPLHPPQAPQDSVREQNEKAELQRVQ